MLPNPLYHITSKDNLESILKVGLNRTAHRQRIGIYLCEHPEHWLGLYKNPVVIRVDTSDIACDVSWFEDLDEYIIWGDIPVEKLEVIAEGPNPLCSNAKKGD